LITYRPLVGYYIAFEITVSLGGIVAYIRTNRDRRCFFMSDGVAGGYGSGFALIVVLFILLIIVGAAYLY
jgi:uncharacterized protein (TIGR01732 family)